MNKFRKNNISTILRECKNDEEIDNLFSTILPPNQNNSYLKLFLQNSETKERCLYSKNMFVFLLSLDASFQNNDKILNYTYSFDEFLSEIQNSEYLYNNIHFVSRSVQAILKYILLKAEIGSFCLISYKAKLIGLESIPPLPLYFNQDQYIDKIANIDFSIIKPFLSKFDEKFLIWCYFENMHKEFCQVIDKRKKFNLDLSAESIIKERIKASQYSIHRDSSLFTEFLSLMYPSIKNLHENKQLLSKKSNSINWINRYIDNDQNDDISLICYNINGCRGYIESSPPIKSVCHYFRSTKFQLNSSFSENMPRSLPPPKKKLIKVQTRPKVELNVIPSIAERFINSEINVKGKNFVRNFEIPSNFICKDFNSTLEKLKGTEMTESSSNQFERNKDLGKPCTNNFNKKQKLTPKLNVNNISNRDQLSKLLEENNKNPACLNSFKKLKAPFNQKIVANKDPFSGHGIDPFEVISEPARNHRLNSYNQKINLKDEENYKGKMFDHASKSNISIPSQNISDDSSKNSDLEDSSNDSNDSNTVEGDDNQNKYEVNLSSYPSSNPPSSNKIHLHQKPKITLAPPKSETISITNNFNNNSPKIQSKHPIQNQATSKVIVQKRVNSNNIIIQKNVSNNQSNFEKS